MQGFHPECHKGRWESHLQTDHWASVTFDFFPVKSEQANKKQPVMQSQTQWWTAVQVRASIKPLVFGVEKSAPSASPAI